MRPSCSRQQADRGPGDARLGELFHGVGGVRAAINGGDRCLLCHWAFLSLELLAFVFKAFDFGPLLAQRNRDICDVRRPVARDPQLLFEEEPLSPPQEPLPGSERSLRLPPCGAPVERQVPFDKYVDRHTFHLDVLARQFLSHTLLTQQIVTVRTRTRPVQPRLETCQGLSPGSGEQLPLPPLGSRFSSSMLMAEEVPFD